MPRRDVKIRPTVNYEIVYSTTPDRANPQSLNGALGLAGEIFIFLSPATGITSVRWFTVTDALYRTETVSPFDLNGSTEGVPAGLDLEVLGSGNYTFKAAVTLSNGNRHILEAEFQATGSITPGQSELSVVSSVPRPTVVASSSVILPGAVAAVGRVNLPGIVATSGSSPAKTARSTLGIHLPTPTSSKISTFESAALGRAVPGVLMDYCGGAATTWSAWVNAFNTFLSQYASRCSGVNPQNRLMVSLNPWPTADTVSTLANVAANTGVGGNLRTYPTQVGQLIANSAYEEENIIIRLMWEPNMAGYEWCWNNSINAPVATAISNYVTLFRNYVDAIRAVAPNVKFAWNILSRSMTLAQVLSGYPGDAYVDIIDMDVYDRDDPLYPPQNSTTWANSWTRTKSTHPQGTTLDWHRQFAIDHGKKMGYGEWGNGWRTDDNSGQDNSYFTQNFIDWLDLIAAEGLLDYHIYFMRDEENGNNDHLLYTYGTAAWNTANRAFTNARAVFHTEMGA